jgi:transcriptional regulator with XRE-family HTH domain
MSQLDLALQASISARHLSFLETGRSRPSRDMVLHLARELDVPLREQNLLLAAAGFAAGFRERPLADPALAAARRAVELVVNGHSPFPALAVDRHWTIVLANEAVKHLLEGVDPELLRPPVNALRIALHPGGLAPQTANLGEWRSHLLERLRRQCEATGDPVLLGLFDELRGYPLPRGARNAPPPGELGTAVVPFELSTKDGVMRFFSTTTVFGTPVDITLAELALECFYPADNATLELLRRPTSRRVASGLSQAMAV